MAAVSIECSPHVAVTDSVKVIPKNPRPMLQELVNDQVIVRLKWGETEYHGTLVSVDSYMNVQLAEAMEVIAGEEKGTLGNILIR